MSESSATLNSILKPIKTMLLPPDSQLRNVTGLSPEQEREIKAFMQGAVYCWIQLRGNDEFAVRDLMGGVNSNWERTPLQVLYSRQIDRGTQPDSARERAATDLGWIVKSLLAEDKREFTMRDSGWGNTYGWSGR
jgi:hypothetical protein